MAELVNDTTLKMLAKELQNGEEFSFVSIHISLELVENGKSLTFFSPVHMHTARPGYKRMKVARLSSQCFQGKVILDSADLSTTIILDERTEVEVETLSDKDGETRTLSVRSEAEKRE
jgi:hypothetical protein